MKHFLFLLLAAPLASCSQTIPSTSADIKKVENSLAPTVIYGDSIPNLNLEERMKATGVKGLSIAVIRNYSIEWAKGYGWADEYDKRKVNTETRFQAASISKSLNSLGVLRLVDQGKIDPEADINTYLRSWKFPYDSLSKGKKIKVYNLLDHTAGLSIHGFPGYDIDSTLPSLPQILDGARPANTNAVRSRFEPGLRFQYSGGGTTISQLIVMDITGRKYDEYMEQEVLKPLGMTNSSYRQPPSETKNLATAYYRSGAAVHGKFHVYPEQAAAGLWTTPTDLAKYIIECQLEYEGRSEKILKKATMQRRMTPYIDKNAALGVFVEKRGNMKWFNHNGGNEAFLCTSYGSLEGGNGVVIMINGDDFTVVNELLNSVARVYNWTDFYKPTFKKVVRLSKDTLQRFVGNYLLNRDTLTISFCGDNLCIQQNRQPDPGYKMVFGDNSTFSVAEIPNATIKAIWNKDGAIDELELNQGGVMRMKRIK